MSAKEHDEKEHKSHGGGHGGAHGGGHEEGHEGAPEWLISFADNVTLMMGFFVIMLAFSMGNKGKGDGEVPKSEAAMSETPDFLDVAIAIREAFNNPVSQNSMDPNEQALVRRVLERRGMAQVEDDGPAGDAHRVQSTRPTNYFAVCGRVTFEANTSELNDAAKTSLTEVARHVRGLRFIVNIRGHVSAAEAYDASDRGMRLSFERSLQVAQTLAEAGVEWRQMRILACGDGDRIAPTVYDWEGHKPNQRVEVEVTNDVVPEAVPAETGAPASGDGH